MECINVSVYIKTIYFSLMQIRNEVVRLCCQAKRKEMSANFYIVQFSSSNWMLYYMHYCFLLFSLLGFLTLYWRLCPLFYAAKFALPLPLQLLSSDCVCYALQPNLHTNESHVKKSNYDQTQNWYHEIRQVDSKTKPNCKDFSAQKKECAVHNSKWS